MLEDEKIYILFCDWNGILKHATNFESFRTNWFSFREKKIPGKYDWFAIEPHFLQFRDVSHILSMPYQAFSFKRIKANLLSRSVQISAYWAVGTFLPLLEITAGPNILFISTPVKGTKRNVYVVHLERQRLGDLQNSNRFKERFRTKIGFYLIRRAVVSAGPGSHSAFYSSRIS